MPDENTIWLIRILKTLIVVMGIYISKASYDAFRRQKNKAMLFLSTGFGLITIGSLLEGVLFELVSFRLMAWIDLDRRS